MVASTERRTARLDVAADETLVAFVRREAGHLARPGRWLADRLERQLARRPAASTCLPDPAAVVEASGLGQALNADVRRAHERGGAGAELMQRLPVLQAAWRRVAGSFAFRPDAALTPPSPWVHRYSLLFPQASRDALLGALQGYPWPRPRMLWALVLGRPWPAPSAGLEVGLEIARQLNNLHQVGAYGVDVADLVEQLFALRMQLLQPVSPS